MLARAFLSIFAVSAVSVILAAAFPSQLNRRSSNCSSVEVRKEWRNLTGAEQIAYLDAEICLMNLPAQTGLAAVTSRYSDLAALHQNLTLIIHDVGQFLPWHRYFVHVHQEILKSQCDYNGPIP
jgi:tyrosinase